MKDLFGALSRGFFFIILGIVFLLINFNYLSWSFWWNVIDLWPLLLILAGIGLFFNKRIPFSAIASVFLICLVGYSLAYGDNNRFFKSHDWSWSIGWNEKEDELRENTEDFYLPLNGEIEKVNFDLELGGATLTVYALDEEESKVSLISGRYEWTGKKGKIDLEHSILGKELNLEFSPDDSFFRSVRRRQAKLNMGLSQLPVYNLNIEAAAINGVLDLSKLKISELDIDTGASDFELRFGDHGTYSKVTIEGAASQIKLVIPESVGVKVFLSGVVSDTNFMGSGVFQDGNVWTSDNFDQAKSKVEFTISLAAGTIDLNHQ